MNITESARTAIILDIKADRIQIRRRRGSLGAGKDFDLLLRLRSETLDTVEETNSTLERLEEILLKEQQRDELCFDNHVLVLGNQCDPFLCGKNRIDLALRVIEFLASHTSALVHVQTRSPLSILALPLLKRIADRSLLTMGLETLNDTLAQRLTPWLPRPSERITAARAIHSLGVATLIQAAPLGLEAEAPRYARTLNEIGTYVYPVSIGTLENQQRSKLLPEADPAKLQRHIPGKKLVENIPQAWEHIAGGFSTTSVAA